MAEFGRGGGQFPRPLGDEVQKEHLEELGQALEHEHQAHEASKARRAGKRRWSSFWRRKPSS